HFAASGRPRPLIHRSRSRYWAINGASASLPADFRLRAVTPPQSQALRNGAARRVPVPSTPRPIGIAYGRGTYVLAVLAFLPRGDCSCVSLGPAIDIAGVVVACAWLSPHRTGRAVLMVHPPE